MTSKGRNAVRLETEIEKCREESRWNRVIELAEQLKQRSPSQGKLGFHSLIEKKKLFLCHVSIVCFNRLNSTE